MKKLILIPLLILLHGCAQSEIPAIHIDKIIEQCGKNNGLKSVIINYGSSVFVTAVKCNDGAVFNIEDTK